MSNPHIVNSSRLDFIHKKGLQDYQHGPHGNIAADCNEFRDSQSIRIVIPLIRLLQSKVNFPTKFS